MNEIPLPVEATQPRIVKLDRKIPNTYQALEADRVDWAINNMGYAIALMSPYKSLDEPIFDGKREGRTRGETIFDSSVDVESEAIANVDFELLLEGLTPRQQSVLRLKFERELHESEIAQVLGLSISGTHCHIVAGLDNVRRKLGVPTVGKESRTPEQKKAYQNAWYRKKKLKMNGGE